MWRRVAEGVVTASIIGVIGGFVGLFFHVQAIEAKQNVIKSNFEYIKKDLRYIKIKLDRVYERNR